MFALASEVGAFTNAFSYTVMRYLIVGMRSARRVRGSVDIIEALTRLAGTPS